MPYTRTGAPNRGVRKKEMRTMATCCGVNLSRVGIVVPAARLSGARFRATGGGRRVPILLLHACSQT